MPSKPTLVTLRVHSGDVYLAGTFVPIHGGDSDWEETFRFKSSEATASMIKKICELEGKEAELTSLLDEMDRKFAMRRAPVEEQRQIIVEEIEQLRVELANLTKPESGYPPALGPRMYSFVESDMFGIVCNVVVLLNLVCMVSVERLPSYWLAVYVLDQLFLLWYVFELIAKWKYHRHNLFVGKIAVVWWNWLDACIVISGVIDQWLMGLLQNVLRFTLPIDCASMKIIRLLRLFRIMRFLKVVRAFLESDLQWTEQPSFQMFMMSVIAVNSVVMALELDFYWGGWHWLEQIFLIIYSFELAVRLKFFGCSFFVNSDLIWNNLDCVMVCGGAFELWLRPAWSLVQAQLYGEEYKHTYTFGGIFRILKMMKLVRVLRLVRLIKIVKPLYALLIGVKTALQAMKWVLVLTLLVLYGGSIVFTSLIGHGYIYGTLADIPSDARSDFGTVSRSYFSLFKLMNGDMSVVRPITKETSGQLLFAVFMVLANWAVLAILTSVVSDNMIKGSQQILVDEKKKDDQDRMEARKYRMGRIFAELDTNKNGGINKTEWDAMLADPLLKEEMCEATDLSEKTLHDVFTCLAETGKNLEKQMRYNDFIEHLHDGAVAADKRSILFVSHLLKEAERSTASRIEELELATRQKFDAMEGMLNKIITVLDGRHVSEVPHGN